MVRHVVTASVLLLASLCVRVEAQELGCCGPCEFKACVGGVEDNAILSSELFFGTVVAEDVLACCEHRADVTFKVIRRWNGAETPRVVIRTEACTGLYPFALGRNYLVFAKGTPPILSRCFPPLEATAADQAMARLESLREARDGPVAAPAAAESGEESSTEFEIVIRHFGVHEGTCIYDLQPESLTITREDRDNQARTRLCTLPLSADQKADWIRFLSAFPADKLAPEYIDPSAEDALYGFTFSIRTAGSVLRTIRVVPTPQADLANLCHRVNALVPAGCAPWPMYCGTK